MIKGKNEMMIAHVNEWVGSGMSIRDFARKIEISKGKFEYWVNKVKNSNEPNRQTSHFIEISALTDTLKPSGEAHKLMKSSAPQIELTFPGGLVLKIYS